MTNRATVAGAIALALLMTSGLAGCGSAKPKAERTTAATSSAAAPTPTSSPTPTVPPQPSGKYGVTYHITNWQRDGLRPEVVAYKQVYEAITGSSNDKTVNAETRSLLTKRMQRTWQPLLGQAWSGSWHVPAKAIVRIGSVAGQGRTRVVTACEWEPSVSYYLSNGKPVDHTPRDWVRLVSTMTEVGGTWKLADYKFRGHCKGAAPR